MDGIPTRPEGTPPMRGRLLRITAPLAAAALVLALGACSDDTAREPASKGRASTDPSAAVDPSRVSPSALPTAPGLEKSAGAVKDASFGACDADPGEQTVTAEVTGSAGEARDYVVTVSWINASYDVLARAVEVAEDLAEGETAELTLTATVPAGAEECTFHVVRGTLR